MKESDQLTAQGDELFAGGDLDGAIACFDRAVRSDPRCAEAWTGRAAVLAARKRNGEALGCIERALDARPGHAPAIVLKATLLVKAGENSGALACFDQALANEPRADLFCQRAKLLAEIGRVDEALASYDRAIALEDRAPTWVDRADLLFQQGRLDEVATAFERAVAADPRHLEAWYRLARMRVRLGRTDAARDAIDRFLAIAPEDDARVSVARRMLGESR